MFSKKIIVYIFLALAVSIGLLLIVKFSIIGKQDIIYPTEKNSTTTESNFIAQNVKKLVQNKNLLVESNESIHTRIDISDYCGKLQKQIVSGENLNKGSRELTNSEYIIKYANFINKNPIIFDYTKLNGSENLFFRYRLSSESEFSKRKAVEIANEKITNTYDEQFVDMYFQHANLFTLEFFNKDGNNFIKSSALPEIETMGCLNALGVTPVFDLYYYSPNLIIGSIPGLESGGQYYYLGNGVRYSINDVIKQTFKLPNDYYFAFLKLNAGEKYFSIIENGCLPNNPTHRLYPGRNTEIIFDIQTKKVADVVLHELDPNECQK